MLFTMADSRISRFTVMAFLLRRAVIEAIKCLEKRKRTTVYVNCKTL